MDQKNVSSDVMKSKVDRTTWLLFALCCINLIFLFSIFCYTMSAITGIKQEILDLRSTHLAGDSNAAIVRKGEVTKQAEIHELYENITNEFRLRIDELESTSVQSKIQTTERREYIDSILINLEEKSEILEAAYGNFAAFWEQMVWKVEQFDNHILLNDTYEVFNSELVSEESMDWSGSGERSSGEEGSGEGHEEVTVSKTLPLLPSMISMLACRNGARGENGVDGSKGDPGIPGLNGIPGSQGQKGVPGEDGLPGFHGSKGDPGIPGNNGLQGSQGLKGDHGVPGYNGLHGARGVKGEPGTNGSAGRTGALGNPGVDGSDGLKGDPGTPGFNGLPGSKGHRGAPGYRGEKGEKGRDGLQGDPGSPGTQGLPGREVIIPDLFPADVIGSVLNTTIAVMERGGLRGPPGLNGKPGINGIDGIPGSDGVPGSNGEDGTPGQDGQDGVNGVTEANVNQLIGLFRGEVPTVKSDQPQASGEADLCYESAADIEHNFIFYKFIKTKASWEDAQKICEGQYHGHLAYFLTGSDFDTVVKNIVEKFSEAEIGYHVWLGGKRSGSGMKWQLPDGSTRNMDISRWHSGEPNNGGGKEGCGEIMRSGNAYLLNDDLCQVKHPYICALN